MTRMRKLLAVAGMTVLLALSAPAAYGQSGSEADTGGGLLFTGADLGVLGVAAGILIALGFVLRRLTRPPVA